MLRYVRFAMLLVFALTLTACSKDPIIADLTAFDAAGSAAFKGLDPASLNGKVSAAKTNEERAAVLAYISKEMRERGDTLAKFQPKTPEVKAMLDSMTKGLREASDGAKEAEAALLKQDAAALGPATKKMQEGQQLVEGVATQFAKLAKEKGYKVVN